MRSTAARDLELLAWPSARLAGALTALAHRSNLSKACLDCINSQTSIAEWIESAAKHLGCEAEPIESNYRDLECDLAASCPALLRLSTTLFLAIAGSRRGKLRVLTPNLRLRSVSTRRVSDAIREPFARPNRAAYETLLEETKIPPARKT
jgi:hypothetical protein